MNRSKTVWQILVALVLFHPHMLAAGQNEKDRAIAEIKSLKGTIVTFPFSVSFDGRNATDAALVPVQKLTDLEGLYLRKCKITDKGMEKLGGLTKLKYLYLGNTEITDKGLEYVKSMTKLSALSLIGTQVTDSGLVHLKGLRELRTLEVTSSKVTPAGIADLKKSLPTLVVR